MSDEKRMIWWGRFDENYSRNRIVRRLLLEDGWLLHDFHPRVSSLAGLEAAAAGLPPAQWIWVPCFRQRDLLAAARYARHRNIPLFFDPLISQYDKQVFERGKYAPGSRVAHRLLDRERRMMRVAQRIAADTGEHARFFCEVLGADPERVFIVPVGAEEELFVPQADVPPHAPVEVLFYGSFIPLQGAEFIVEAARRVPEVTWTLLGRGPIRARCEAAAAGLPQVRFEDPVAYDRLAGRIGQADILLGIFGTTPKAARVIPNKVYQSLACARPVITMESPVYSSAVRAAADGGIGWVPSGDPAALAELVREWASLPERLRERGVAARAVYEQFYSNAKVTEALRRALAG